MMKKYSYGIVAVLLVVLPMSAALAWDCRGPGAGRGYAQQDPATDAATQKFLTDTTDLRKQVASKQTELDAVMTSANPDAKAAGALSREIFDLKEQLRAKANEAGVSGPFGYGAGCPGYGSGYGRGGQGGRGYCFR